MTSHTGQCARSAGHSLPRVALSIGHLSYVLVFCVGFVIGVRPIQTWDFWWHLAAGRLIAEFGHVPHRDVFSYTAAGTQWVMFEWAWQLTLYALYSAWGFLAIVVLKACVSGLIGVLMLHLAYRRGARMLVAVALTVLAMQPMGAWLNERPQLLQPLFVLSALHLLESHRQGRGHCLLAYPLLMLVWANCHGSFVLGLVLLAVSAFCDLAAAAARSRGSIAQLRQAVGTQRPVTVALILSGVACTIGPNGLRGALYPVVHLGHLSWAEDQIAEWGRAWSDPLTFAGIGCCAFLALVSHLLWRRHARLLDWAYLALGLLMWLRWARCGPILASLTVPAAAAHLSAWIGNRWPSARQLEKALGRLFAGHGALDRILPCLIAAHMSVVALLQAPWSRAPERLVALGRLPVRAAEVIALNDARGRMFNEYEWGGYLIWRFHWTRPVFIDGRSDFYGQKIFGKYCEVRQATPSWRAVLDDFRVQYLLLDAKGPLCDVLDRSASFVRLYADSGAILYVRRTGPNTPLIRRSIEGSLELPGTPLPDASTVRW
jgi:hypothetical protein